MAIIVCPDCSKGVSSLAPYCPHCRRPISQHDENYRSRNAEAIKDVSNTSKRGIVTVIGLAVLLIGGGVFGLNYFMLQSPMSQVLNSDPKNDGILFFAHYGYYILPSVLVVDLRRVESDKAPLDVFRVFLQFASQTKERRFERVELAHQGRTKFLLQGEYFQTLGREYTFQNPVFTARTFPEHLYHPDGKQAFEHWSGGMISVLKEQMEDFREFHQDWYIKDITGSQ